MFSVPSVVQNLEITIPEIPPFDRPQDRVFVAPGVKLDPGSSDAGFIMGVVGGNLWVGDFRDFKFPAAEAAIGDFDGIEGAGLGRGFDAVEDLWERKIVFP